MLRWAADAKLIESNPLADTKPLKVRGKAYRRALTEDEARALIEKSPERYSRMWAFMLGTGFRKTETIELQWEDIDFERREVYISGERSKNNTAATVPLSDGLTAMLRDLQEQTGAKTGHVFLTRDGTPWHNNLDRRFHSCVRQAGIEPHGVTIHSLRYSFATHLLRQGVPIQTVQRLGRWKTVDVLLNIYAQTFPADERDAVERLPYLTERLSGAKARKGA